MKYIPHDPSHCHQSWPTYMDILRVAQGISNQIYQVFQLAHTQPMWHMQHVVLDHQSMVVGQNRPQLLSQHGFQSHCTIHKPAVEALKCQTRILEVTWAHKKENQIILQLGSVSDVWKIDVPEHLCIFNCPTEFPWITWGCCIVTKHNNDSFLPFLLCAWIAQ